LSIFFRVLLLLIIKLGAVSESLKMSLLTTIRTLHVLDIQTGPRSLGIIIVGLGVRSLRGSTTLLVVFLPLSSFTSI
jgi:hypothetical protein